MKITLKIKGKDKEFLAPFISGRMLRRTLEFTKKANIHDLDLESMDELVEHVVLLFGKQFTLDEFYDGIESTEMMPTITDCMTQVIHKTNKVVEALQDPNDQASQ